MTPTSQRLEPPAIPGRFTLRTRRVPQTKTIRFPWDGGAADVDAEVSCPYCAVPVTIAVDPGSGDLQQYVEDGSVRCQPRSVTVTL